MINIFAQRVHSREVKTEPDDSISHFTINTDVDDYYFLSQKGVLSSTTSTWYLNDVGADNDTTWFQTHFICETGNVASLSYKGNIVSVHPDSPLPSLEGNFDDSEIESKLNCIIAHAQETLEKALNSKGLGSSNFKNTTRHMARR